MAISANILVHYGGRGANGSDCEMGDVNLGERGTLISLEVREGKILRKAQFYVKWNQYDVEYGFLLQSRDLDIIAKTVERIHIQ